MPTLARSGRSVAMVAAALAVALCGMSPAHAADPGDIVTVAGNGTTDLVGDNSPAISAGIGQPWGVAFTADGGFLIAGSLQVRKVLNGIITNVAGNGENGYDGDGGAATGTALRLPTGLAVTADGGFLIADTGNNRIRKVLNGVISTVAGTGSINFVEDNIPAVSANINRPYGVTATADGGFLITDTFHHRIRKVLSNGTITTVAGNGAEGFSGDNGPATAAKLNFPGAAVATADGGILIADTYNHRIRRVLPDGTIITLAGDGTAAFSGDNSPATSAKLNQPWGVALTADGGFLIADTENNRIRKVLSNGTITTVAGTGDTAFGGDNGPATSATLDLPFGVAAAPDGGFLIADTGHHRVRRVIGSTPLVARTKTQIRAGWHTKPTRTKAGVVVVKVYPSSPRATGKVKLTLWHKSKPSRVYSGGTKSLYVGQTWFALPTHLRGVWAFRVTYQGSSSHYPSTWAWGYDFR